MRESPDIRSLYVAHSDNVYKYIYFMVKDQHTAEDLTQETFIKVLNKLHSFEFNSDINTWIFKISRNVTIDYLRRKKLIRFFAIDRYTNKLVHKDDLLINQLILSEEVGALYSALSLLKKEYKEVLILRKINELSIKETAIILNWSEDKVKSMTSRALIRLRKEIIDEEGKVNESFQ